MQYKFAVITDVWNVDFVSFFHAVLLENVPNNRLTPVLVGTSIWEILDLSLEFVVTVN